MTASPNENEAAVAVSKLTELLQRHNLSVADLEEKGAAAPEVSATDVDTRSGKHLWKLVLARVLSKHFFCYAMTDNWDRKTPVKFIGRPENVESLKMIYSWLLRQIEQISRAEHINYPEIHGIRWARHFGDGMVGRLEERLRELRERMAEDPTMMALVIHHESEISDWMEENMGRRIDGKMTKKEAAREANMEAMKLSDPEEYYRRRPWERPQPPAVPKTEVELAAAEAASDRYWDIIQKRRMAAKKRWEGHHKAYDSSAYDSDMASRAGERAADKVNLQPFLRGGEKDDRLIG